MELEEAEQAAIREGRRISEASVQMANVGKPRDPIEVNYVQPILQSGFDWDKVICPDSK